ncbi:MAG: acyl carrier protein [Rhodobacteraceae bacterium]|nr:acyl carrier protein [Paracoccaceae bacterium]
MSVEKKITDLLAVRAKAQTLSRDDILFGDGLNISSIAFTEFVMVVEEEFDIDIDMDDLDASIRTVGQLVDIVAGYARR